MSSQDSFIKEFIVIRDGVIRPALENIGHQLIERGHDYNIDEGVQLSLPVPDSPPYGGVTLEVFPSDVDWKAIERLRPFNKVPSITFGLDLAQRKLNVFVHPNCESGKRILRPGPWVTKTVSSYGLNEITPQVIQHEVKESFRKIPFDVELRDESTSS